MKSGTYSIRNKIATGFLLMIALFAMAAVALFFALTSVKETAHGLLINQERRAMIFLAEREILDFDANFEQLLTVDDGEYQDRLADNLSSIIARKERLITLYADSPLAGMVSELETPIHVLKKEVTPIVMELKRGRDGVGDAAVERTYGALRILQGKISELAAINDKTFDESITRTNLLIKKTLTTFGIMGLIVTLVAVGASLISARTITRPLFALIETTKKFGGGDYKHRAVIQSRDEVGELAGVFNDMAEHLSRYTFDLEKIVAERTRALTIANAQLMELDKAKSEFISVAAHQLRTPLSTVRWVIGVLQENDEHNLSDEQKKYLSKGEVSGTRMEKLVSDLLNVARIESGKMEYHFALISLDTLIAEIVSEFLPFATKEKIALQFTNTGGAPMLCQADAERIRFVFENLIENSIKYTNSGGTIEVRISPHEDGCMVTIADTGIGIPDAAKPNIFSKLFRAENAIRKDTEGNGIGLFVAKTIVALHGGSIDFSSTLGVGTTFEVALPSVAQFTARTQTQTMLNNEKDVKIPQS